MAMNNLLFLISLLFVLCLSALILVLLTGLTWLSALALRPLLVVRASLALTSWAVVLSWLIALLLSFLFGRFFLSFRNWGVLLFVAVLLSILTCRLLFLLLFVKAGDALTGQQVYRFLWLFHLAVFFKRKRLFSLLVHLDDFHSPFAADGFQVCGKVLVCGVGHQSCQDVCLEQIVIVVFGLQDHLLARHFPAGFHILVYLIVEAALQFRAHACQLLRVE